jgi:hypothetical protein
MLSHSEQGKWLRFGPIDWNNTSNFIVGKPRSRSVVVAARKIDKHERL